MSSSSNTPQTIIDALAEGVQTLGGVALATAPEFLLSEARPWFVGEQLAGDAKCEASQR